MISQMQDNEDSPIRNHSNFSIEHILNHAGEKFIDHNQSSIDDNRKVYHSTTFSWLQCTRFCPPKIPRIPKREGPHKRQLGRYPRIPFTNHQITILEEKFQQNPYLSSEEAVNLSKQLQLTVVKIKIWFQNRRARKRREDLGELKMSSTISQSAHSETGYNEKDAYDCTIENKNQCCTIENKNQCCTIENNNQTVSFHYLAEQASTNSNRL